MTPRATSQGTETVGAADWMATMGNEVARMLAKQQDDVIRNAINVRLGHSSWTIPEIAKRMRREVGPLGPVVSWILDDKKLLDIWPIETKTVVDGDQTKLVWTQPYKLAP